MSQLAFTFRYSAPILLILMTITAIFLFIYFLDYVTSTNKFGTVIQSVVNQKFVTMKNQLAEIEEVHVPWENLPFVEITTIKLYQSFDEKKLLEIASSESVFISFLYPKETFLIEGLVLMKIYSDKTVS
jgi:uncharacterized membrane protein